MRKKNGNNGHNGGGNGNGSFAAYIRCPHCKDLVRRRKSKNHQLRCITRQKTIQVQIKNDQVVLSNTKATQRNRELNRKSADNNLRSLREAKQMMSLLPLNSRQDRAPWTRSRKHFLKEIASKTNAGMMRTAAQ